MSKSIYIDAHASVSRPHTRKPYHHPWWRQCYRLYERRLDHIHAQYPHAYRRYAGTPAGDHEGEWSVSSMNDGHPYRARGAGWDGLTRDEKHFYLWTLLVSTAAVVVAICVGAVIHG